MSRRVITETDVIDLVRMTGKATNTDVARAFHWKLNATTRGLERLVRRGLLRPVLSRPDGSHPRLYRVADGS